MVYFTPCKINLGLQVLSKRQDGYHEIETCFYPVPWTDILEIIQSDHFAFTSSGSLVSGRAEDNLCWKAYALLQRELKIGPVQIHLHKIIPAGAGLGGGSSDASATLLILNEIFSLGLDKSTLLNYAAVLGSDCPFFVEAQPSLGTGRGDKMISAPVSLKGMFLVLICPGIQVSTAEAYLNVIPKQPKDPLQQILAKPFKAWRDDLVNDFEHSVFSKFPQLGAIKKKLYELGCLYASMSGSGSAIFGLFDEANDPSADFPGMKIWTGWLLR